MDHRPFEDWLLNDDNLTPEQDRVLRLHLRTCSNCAALARANLSLRSAVAIPPEAGFADRFKLRLAAQRRVQRWHSLIGLTLLALLGTLVVILFLYPYMSYFLLPPDRLASFWLSQLVGFTLLARSLEVLGSTLFDLASTLIPVYIWVLFMVLFTVIGFFMGAVLHFVGLKARSAA